MRHVLRDHGYLLVDHSNSPGVPEWMARMAGYDPKQVGEGKTMDIRTLCCAHCKTHVVPNPRRPNSDRATCPKCDHHYICDVCAFHASMPDYVHTPYEKVVDLTLAGKTVPMSALESPPKLLMP